MQVVNMQASSLVAAEFVQQIEVVQEGKKLTKTKSPQAWWFSDNISLIQSQHIYIHSGFQPIIVSF